MPLAPESLQLSLHEGFQIHKNLFLTFYLLLKADAFRSLMPFSPWHLHESYRAFIHCFVTFPVLLMHLLLYLAHKFLNLEFSCKVYTAALDCLFSPSNFSLLNHINTFQLFPLRSPSVSSVVRTFHHANSAFKYKSLLSFSICYVVTKNQRVFDFVSSGVTGTFSE